MPLNIKSSETDRLARELAAETGESITEAVQKALAERLERFRRQRDTTRRTGLREIRDRVSALPQLDGRNDDEILGYDRAGSFS
jgi:antitoxin VapB